MLLPCWGAAGLLFAWYLHLTAVQQKEMQPGGGLRAFWLIQQGTGCQESPAHSSQALPLGHSCYDTQWDRPLGEN